MSFYPVAALPDTNARQPAITMRESSTALLTIDSEDRFTDYVMARSTTTGQNASPYDFAISKSESLMPGFITRIGVSEVVFPWVIPNINVKTNKMYYNYFLNGVGPTTGTIDLGNAFLRPAEIAAAIEGIVSIDVPGFTMEYAADGLGNPVFTYATNDVSNNIQFDPLPYNSTAYPYPPQTKQLFDLLGFTDANMNFATANGGNYTFCQAIRYVDIVCNQLTNSQAQKDQTSQTVARDMLCRIYLGDGNLSANVSASNAGTSAATIPEFCPVGCAPFTIYRNYTTPKQIQWIPNQNIPGYLRFQVYDDAGALLSESTGLDYNEAGQYGNSDWSMTMLVSEN